MGFYVVNFSIFRPVRSILIQTSTSTCRLVQQWYLKTNNHNHIYSQSPKSSFNLKSELLRQPAIEPWDAVDLQGGGPVVEGAALQGVGPPQTPHNMLLVIDEMNILQIRSWASTSLPCAYRSTCYFLTLLMPFRGLFLHSLDLEGKHSDRENLISK